MEYLFKGRKVHIPDSYHLVDDGIFRDRRGVEYTIVQYGSDDAVAICLETIYSKHVKTIELDIIP